MRVLHIEDDAGEARLLAEALRGAPEASRWEIVRATTLEQGLRLVQRGGLDAVLLDLGLPDSQRLASLQAVRKADARVPVVVLTGLEDEETALQALRDGAQDYLLKGRVTGPALVRVLHHGIARAGIQGRMGPRHSKGGGWSRVRLVHVHPAEHEAALARHVAGIGDTGGMVVLASFGASAGAVRECLHKGGVKTSGLLVVDATPGGPLARAGKVDLEDVAVAVEGSCDRLGIRSQVVLDNLNQVMEGHGATAASHFMRVVANRMRALGVHLDFFVVDDAAGRALAAVSAGAVDTVMTARAPPRGVTAR